MPKQPAHMFSTGLASGLAYAQRNEGESTLVSRSRLGNQLLDGKSSHHITNNDNGSVLNLNRKENPYKTTDFHTIADSKDTLTG